MILRACDDCRAELNFSHPLITVRRGNSAAPDIVVYDLCHKCFEKYFAPLGKGRSFKTEARKGN